MDEYPPEGAPAKPPVKKATKAVLKPAKKPIAINTDTPVEPIAEPIDEIPVGMGKKFEISEFAEGHEEDTSEQ